MNKSKELQEFQKAFPSEAERELDKYPMSPDGPSKEFIELQEICYKVNLKLYLEGKIKKCPQCGQDNGHHKMDCGVRFEEDVYAGRI